MSREELLEEQQRLLQQLGGRLATASGLYGAVNREKKPSDRLSQTAHDYLDVQYLLRHIEE